MRAIADFNVRFPPLSFGRTFGLDAAGSREASIAIEAAKNRADKFFFGDDSPLLAFYDPAGACRDHVLELSEFVRTFDSPVEFMHWLGEATGQRGRWLQPVMSGGDWVYEFDPATPFLQPGMVPFRTCSWRDGLPRIDPERLGGTPSRRVWGDLVWREILVDRNPVRCESLGMTRVCRAMRPSASELVRLEEAYNRANRAAPPIPEADAAARVERESLWLDAFFGEERSFWVYSPIYTLLQRQRYGGIESFFNDILPFSRGFSMPEMTYGALEFRSLEHLFMWERCRCE